MQLQYISDNQGHTMAVQLQIPIEDWNELKKKYAEFEEEERAATIAVPEWQIKLGRQEVESVVNETAELTEWNAAKQNFKC